MPASIGVVVALILLLLPASVAAQPTVSDGAAITPAVADALYGQLAPLHEADGCRLVSFDTSRFRIEIGLRTPSGAHHSLDLATANAHGDVGRRAGGWTLGVPADADYACHETVGAIGRVLAAAAAPRQSGVGPGRGNLGRASYPLLAASFVLLVLGTARLLYREARRRRPPATGVLALVLVWGVALALRLELSPHTFLHEYYHIAETISAYLAGEMAPAYGNAGPALFRLVGSVLGRPDDVEVIFATNAVVASLAIPAVALLDLALMRSWPRAICAAALLCVLPHHLRFSASEDLFVPAVTLGMWSLALLVVYVRTRRLGDALLGVLALSLAMQTRPEMLCFPAVAVALLLLAKRRSWRVLIAPRTLVALAAMATLLIPRMLSLRQSLASPPAFAPGLPTVGRYFANLVLLQPQVTPAVYWALLAVGLAWGALRRPGFVLWVILVFCGFTLLSLSLFSNPVFNLRSQLLPTSFVVMVAAGAAPAWIAIWGHRVRMALGVGACALAVLGTLVVLAARPFVTELRDQQLEWAFLERTVPRLPDHATLLAAASIGGHKLDAFPQYLLSRAGKSYDMVDVGRAATGDEPWPPPGEDLIFYQGMFCYFAFQDEPSPEPMTASCKAVHDRYRLQPLFVEELHTQGYSQLSYATGGKGPFRIGFFRLEAAP